MPRHANASKARPYEGGVGSPGTGKANWWDGMADNRSYNSSRQTEIMAAAERSKLPDAPCHRCGARGFCGHNGRVPENWE
jgi:hypothetical protein